MPKIIQTEVFYFNELSDKAKAKARDWMRENQDSTDLECTIEYITEACKILGIEAENVYFDSLYCQGEGAGVEGCFSYDVGMLTRLKEYAPQDQALQDVGQAFFEAYKVSFYTASGRVRTGHQYLHTIVSEIDTEQGNFEQVENLFTQAFKDLDKWILKQIKEQCDWINSEEYIDDMLTANEYTFTANGKRFG